MESINNDGEWKPCSCNKGHLTEICCKTANCKLQNETKPNQTKRTVCNNLWPTFNSGESKKRKNTIWIVCGSIKSSHTDGRWGGAGNLVAAFLCINCNISWHRAWSFCWHCLGNLSLQASVPHKDIQIRMHLCARNGAINRLKIQLKVWSSENPFEKF